MTDIIQTLTTEQIQEVARRTGVTEGSVRDTIDTMNKNDFIAVGLVDMTPDMVVGFLLSEQQAEGLL